MWAAILRGSIAPHGALAVMATAPSASRTKTVKPAGPVRRGVGASFLLDARALPANRRADDHHSMAGREGFDVACGHALRLEEKLLKTSRHKYPEHPNVGFGQICPRMRHALGNGKSCAGRRIESYRRRQKIPSLPGRQNARLRSDGYAAADRIPARQSLP